MYAIEVDVNGRKIRYEAPTLAEAIEMCQYKGGPAMMNPYATFKEPTDEANCRQVSNWVGVREKGRE